jgi:hypothetical protein
MTACLNCDRLCGLLAFYTDKMEVADSTIEAHETAFGYLESLLLDRPTRKALTARSRERDELAVEFANCVTMLNRADSDDPSAERERVIVQEARQLFVEEAEHYACFEDIPADGDPDASEEDVAAEEDDDSRAPEAAQSADAQPSIATRVGTLPPVRVPKAPNAGPTAAQLMAASTAKASGAPKATAIGAPLATVAPPRVACRGPVVVPPRIAVHGRAPLVAKRARGEVGGLRKRARDIVDAAKRGDLATVMSP